MNNELLIYVGTLIAAVGMVSAIISAIVFYRNIKKEDSNGKFKDCLQTPLINSDCSIKKAVKYLKIVNSSWDANNDNE